MWAVIEFSKKDCCVVPYSWVHNDTFCFWPNKITQKTLKEWVAEQKNPSSNWPKYDIFKVHHMADNLEAAEEYLTKIIEETTTSTDGKTDPSVLVRRIIQQSSDEEDLEEQPMKKGKRILKKKPRQGSSKKQKLQQTADTSSADDFSDEDSPVQTTPKSNQKSNQSPGRVPPFSVQSTSRSGSNTPTRYSFEQSASTAIQSSSGIGNSRENQLSVRTSTPALSSALGELLLKKIEQVIATQDQHAIILDNISRNQASQNISRLERPADMPNLPVSTKQEYKALETFLNDELPFAYLKKRLAAVGGSSVRNVVMGMLKFILTNQVAMKFNWAGRDKRPFKKTNMFKVVREAVRYAYRGNGGDGDPSHTVTDKIIEDAVKDWLKLAKARHSYSMSKTIDNV